MEIQSPLLRLTARLILATLIVLILVIGKSFLVPFAWSLLIALSSLKFINWMEKNTRISLSLIIFIFLLLILVALFSIGYYFYIELTKIFSDMPAISMKISERLHDLSLSLKGMGIALPENLNKDFITDWVNKHTDVIYNFASGFAMNLWDIVLVLFYLFFLLYYKDNTEHFFTAHIKDRRRLVVIRNRINESITLIRGYISGMVVLSLILAVMNLAVFLIFGLKFAFFFAVFLAILNLIPLIGNLIGLAFIMLFAIITKDNMVVPLLILVSLFIVNFLQDNVIRPWLMGDKLKINAFSVFLAIIIGGMIWGVSGMILFIPIVGTIKIMLENNEKHGSYAIFFSEVPKKHKTKVHEDEDEAESTN